MKTASDLQVVVQENGELSSARKNGGVEALFAHPGAERMEEQKFVQMKPVEQMFTMDHAMSISLPVCPIDGSEAMHSCYMVIVVICDARSHRVQPLRFGISDKLSAVCC